MSILKKLFGKKAPTPVVEVAKPVEPKKTAPKKAVAKPAAKPAAKKAPAKATPKKK